LAGQVLTTFKQQIKELKLIPSRGGCFELVVNGKLLFSKLKEGQFPDEQWVLDEVGARLK
jgi:selenoprotein W-related protein